MGLESYLSMEYPTPHDIKNTYHGCSALVIGSGPSTSNLLQYKDKLKSKFNVVIGVNRTIRDFEDIMTYHLVMEKNPISVVKDMEEMGYKRDLTRVLNYKAIKMFPDDIPIIKARREYFGGKVHMENYRLLTLEGLLENKANPEIHYGTESALYSGTVSIQALHLACILGCKKIYMIGVELMLDGEYDHYYKDRSYRDKVTRDTSRSELINIPFNGRTICTPRVFYQSAKFFDHVISESTKPIGIEVFDFSYGLINEARKLDIDSFFC